MEEWKKTFSENLNIQNYFTYLFSFKKALGETIKKFGNNIPEKSNSWVNCNISFLNEKLTKNYNEYYRYGNIDSLTDIINYALMLLERALIEQKIRVNAINGRLADNDNDDTCDYWRNRE